MLNNSQHQFEWTDYDNSQGGPDSIKVECLSEPFSLLSSPSSPSLAPTSRRRSSHPGSSYSPKRVRPYPPLPREPRSRIENSSEMATTPAYWTSPSRLGGSTSRPTNTNERRASDGTHHLMYNPAYSMGPAYSRPDSSDEHRSPAPSSGSSGTSSSLTGAMGDTHIPAGWVQAQAPVMAGQSPYPGVAGGMTAFMDPPSSAAGTPYQYRNSPSLSPPSPFPSPTFVNPFPPDSTSAYPPTTGTPAPGYHTAGAQETEIRRLRKRLRDVEQMYERAMEQVRALESRPVPRTAAHSSPPMGSPPPPNAAFMASWKARTDARIRQYCSLNRAGNALCAWHDSRRERRVHPPRMAPSGYLNCGCTYEEALFEESLSRHHVGSYLPGETVRMDPALRNPLLKLLQTRYGYRDGDFERDPRNGDWLPGEGPAMWEQQVQAGTNPRRERR